MSEPHSVVAGDTVTWTRSDAERLPADGWALSYVLVCLGKDPISIAAQTDGTAYRVSIPAATSSTWSAGEYSWTAILTKGPDRATVASGVLTIKPDPAAADATTDPRSNAQKAVAAIEAALVRSAGDLIVEYEMDGIKVKKDRKAAMQELSIWKARVRMERGGSVMTSHPVRFT